MKQLVTARGKRVPASPFELLQEIYINDPWKMLVCCIMLNHTTRKQVDKVREKFFEQWPNAASMILSNPDFVIETVRSLGFYNKRAKSLLQFSKDWIEKDWKTPDELYGIGSYALDSWNIFVEGQLPDAVTDHVLAGYVEWRKTLET